MHEHDHFTLMVQNTDRTVSQISLQSLTGTTILTDVPQKDTPYAQYRCTGTNYQGDVSCIRYYEGMGSTYRMTVYHLTIHLHSPAEINGAGWNHGKFGSGTTTVVE
jgi:hypothetical protein